MYELYAWRPLRKLHLTYSCGGAPYSSHHSATEHGERVTGECEMLLEQGKVVNSPPPQKKTSEKEMDTWQRVEFSGYAPEFPNSFVPEPGPVVCSRCRNGLL